MIENSPSFYFLSIKELSGIALLALCELRRCSCKDDLSAVVSAFRTEVNDVVGSSYDVEIVLDDDD